MAQHDGQIAQRDETIASKDREILYRQTRIDQLTHEMADLKRWKFGRSREQLDTAQASLLDEAIDADIAAIELQLENLAPSPETRSTAPELPRVDKHHEPECTRCATASCGCTLNRIGEDVSDRNRAELGCSKSHRFYAHHLRLCAAKVM